MAVEPEHGPKQRIYLDVCVLCRPFADQDSLRIRLETDALYLTLEHIRKGDYTLIVSPVHMAEINASTDDQESKQILDYLNSHGLKLDWDHAKVRERAENLYTCGLGPADAALVAFAEASAAIFVSCDDALLRRCRRLQIRAMGPIEFVEREGLR